VALAGECPIAGDVAIRDCLGYELEFSSFDTRLVEWNAVRYTRPDHIVSHLWKA
jgi:hypothetical protein